MIHPDYIVVRQEFYTLIIRVDQIPVAYKQNI